MTSPVSFDPKRMSITTLESVDSVATTERANRYYSLKEQNRRLTMKNRELESQKENANLEYEEMEENFHQMVSMAQNLQNEVQTELMNLYTTTAEAFDAVHEMSGSSPSSRKSTRSRKMSVISAGSVTEADVDALEELVCQIEKGTGGSNQKILEKVASQRWTTLNASLSSEPTSKEKLDEVTKLLEERNTVITALEAQLAAKEKEKIIEDTYVQTPYVEKLEAETKFLRRQLKAVMDNRAEAEDAQPLFTHLPLPRLLGEQLNDAPKPPVEAVPTDKNVGGLQAQVSEGMEVSVQAKGIQLERISDKSDQVGRISESGNKSERVSESGIQLERVSEIGIQPDRISERSIPSERISAEINIQDASSLQTFERSDVIRPIQLISGHKKRSSVVLERSSTFNVRAPSLGHSDAARITQPVAKPVAARGTAGVKARLMRSITEGSHDISYVIPAKNVFAPRYMANLTDNAVVNQAMDMKREMI